MQFSGKTVIVTGGMTRLNWDNALKRTYQFNEMLNKCFEYAYDAD